MDTDDTIVEEIILERSQRKQINQINNLKQKIGNIDQSASNKDNNSNADYRNNECKITFFPIPGIDAQVEPRKHLKMIAMNVLLPFLWGFVDLRVDCEICHVGVEHYHCNAEIYVGVDDAGIDCVEGDDALNQVGNISEYGDAHNLPSYNENAVRKIEINLFAESFSIG